MKARCPVLGLYMTVMQLQGFDALELSRASTRIAIVPALGAKLASMRMADREWLWTSDTLPYARGRDGASYVETADTGGYDECFPTVGPCELPPSVTPWGGLRLPDHGELWAQEPDIDVGRHWIEARWRGRRMPYRFVRRVDVGARGELAMAYAVTNEGDAPLPFVWSSHPLLPLSSSTHIAIPEGSRVRVYAEHGIDLGGALAEHRWPHVGPLDAWRPGALATSYACKLFVDPARGEAAVLEDGARLEVRFELAEVPTVGLWLNHAGWTPFAGGVPYRNLGLEPCIGAPDTLDEALGAWSSAHWLAPGRTRTWSLEWTAT